MCILEIYGTIDLSTNQRIDIFKNVRTKENPRLYATLKDVMTVMKIHCELFYAKEEIMVLYIIL